LKQGNVCTLSFGKRYSVSLFLMEAKEQIDWSHIIDRFSYGAPRIRYGCRFVRKYQ
jgi:hypothetical protein